MNFKRVPIPTARAHHHGAEAGYKGIDRVFCFDCQSCFSPVAPEPLAVIITIGGDDDDDD